MKPRTIVEVPASEQFSYALDTWAVENEYVMQVNGVGPDGPERIYQRGNGFWVAPQMLRVIAKDTIRIEAWIKVGLYVRIMSFFMLPSEMEIGSGGFRGALPRKKARNMVNALLARLGTAPIP